MAKPRSKTNSVKAVEKYRKTHPMVAREANRRYRECYPERKIDAMLRYNHGITLKEYDILFAKQEGLCAICGEVEQTGSRLSVDHNHKTNVVRELLCRSCNVKLSGVEDKKYHKKALTYLKKHRKRGTQNGEA